MLGHAIPRQPCPKRLFHAADLVGQPKAVCKSLSQGYGQVRLAKISSQLHRPSALTNFYLGSKNIFQLAVPSIFYNFSVPKYPMTMTNA